MSFPDDADWALASALRIVGRLQPGDRLTVPDGADADASSLSALPAIEPAGVWQSVVRMSRGQTRQHTATYLHSLVRTVQARLAVEMTSTVVDSLLSAASAAQVGLAALEKTYESDTRMCTLLSADAIALGLAVEMLVQKKHEP